MGDISLVCFARLCILAACSRVWRREGGIRDQGGTKGLEIHQQSRLAES